MSVAPEQIAIILKRIIILEAAVTALISICAETATPNQLDRLQELLESANQSRNSEE